MEGWIKLHRQLTKWEWYKDPNTFKVFIHLLLLANHEEGQWQGQAIKRGELITSVNHLSEECGISTQNVRTALKRLKSTHEITSKTTNKFTLISIENYEKYQGEPSELTNNLTNNLTINQQTTNKQLTTNKNDNNNNNIYINNININKYKEKLKEKNPVGFYERMRFLREIQEEDDYNLSPEEESELRLYVLGRSYHE